MGFSLLLGSDFLAGAAKLGVRFWYQSTAVDLHSFPACRHVFRMHKADLVCTAVSAVLE